jgi:hypothetical protein
MADTQPIRAARRIVNAILCLAVALAALAIAPQTASAEEAVPVGVVYAQACTPGLAFPSGCVWKWGPGPYDFSRPSSMTATSQTYLSLDTTPNCVWDNNGVPAASNSQPKVYQVVRQTLLAGYYWKTTKYSDGTAVKDPQPVILRNEPSMTSKYTENRRCSYPKRSCSSYRAPFPVSTAYRYYLDRDRDGWACEV